MTLGSIPGSRLLFSLHYPDAHFVCVPLYYIHPFRSTASKEHYPLLRCKLDPCMFKTSANDQLHKLPLMLLLPIFLKIPILTPPRANAFSYSLRDGRYGDGDHKVAKMTS